MGPTERLDEQRGLRVIWIIAKGVPQLDGSICTASEAVLAVACRAAHQNPLSVTRAAHWHGMARQTGHTIEFCNKGRAIVRTHAACLGCGEGQGHQRGHGFYPVFRGEMAFMAFLRRRWCPRDFVCCFESRNYCFIEWFCSTVKQSALRENSLLIAVPSTSSF